MTYAQHLDKYGYAIVPCLDNVEYYTQEFRETLSKFPEYNAPRNMVDNGIPFVKGGFAALGNPSSFHNTFVRKIRRMAHMCVLDNVFLDILDENKDLKFEQVIDRTMFRRVGDKPVAESWHRDESSGCKPGDTIYGGWINLDNYSQYFSGCPGTHKEVETNRGFAAIDNPKKMKRKRNESDADYDKRKAIAVSEWDRLQSLKKKIEIPPGHIFMFYERMVHEVVPSPKMEDQHRVFLGWRTTTFNEPLFPDLERRLRDFDIIPIKSGQIPWMYSSNHWMFGKNRENLVEWSKVLKDQCCELRKMKSGQFKGQKYRVVHKNMSSLKEYGLVTNLCPPYTQEEIDLLKPLRYDNETESEEEQLYLFKL